jgi:hypothetical protein
MNRVEGAFWSVLLVVLGVAIMVSLPPENAGWWMLLGGAGAAAGVGLGVLTFVAGRR